MRALRDRLRGHARAVLDTSLLHIQAHLHLVDDRHEDGQHAARWCVEAGHAAPLDPAWSPHRASPNDLQQRLRALSDQVRPPGSKRIDLQPVRISSNEVVRRPMTKSVSLDAPLDGDEHT